MGVGFFSFRTKTAEICARFFYFIQKTVCFENFMDDSILEPYQLVVRDTFIANHENLFPACVCYFFLSIFDHLILKLGSST